MIDKRPACVDIPGKMDRAPFCVPGRITMLDKRSGSRLANLWDDAKAEGMSGPELLVYRSNTLGSDKRVTNYGGGNTSSKVWQKDPLTGEDVEVLWVKGSGGDSASIKLD